MAQTAEQTRCFLVTGSHRSGTTWVGKILSHHPSLEYVHEPLNCNVTPETWGVLPAQRPHWYQHIGPHNEAIYLEPYRDLLRFRYAIGPALGRLQPNGHGYRPEELKLLERYTEFARNHLQGKVPLIKDPFALVSVPWFVDRLGARTLITVRHPAAFVSSLRRLGWSFGLDDFLAQPELLARYPIDDGEREAQERYKREGDEIRSAALGWKYLHRIVLDLRENRSDVLFVRHEDLSRQPLEGFREILGSWGFEMTPEIERAIHESSDASNPVEEAVGRHHGIRLNSAAAATSWKKRLTPAEVEAVREVSGEIGEAFYRDEEW